MQEVSAKLLENKMLNSMRVLVSFYHLHSKYNILITKFIYLINTI